MTHNGGFLAFLMLYVRLEGRARDDWVELWGGASRAGVQRLVRFQLWLKVYWRRHGGGLRGPGTVRFGRGGRRGRERNGITKNGSALVGKLIGRNREL